MSEHDDIDTLIAEQYDAAATPLLPFGVNNSSVRALDAERTENKRRFIFAALLNGERFNSIEARNRWGCDRLSARIGELRGKGYRILADIGEDRRAAYWMPQDEIERIRGEVMP